MIGNTAEISIWIPLISVLCGGSIALTSTFLNAWYTKDRESTYAKEQRDRDRLERIYRLLISTTEWAVSSFRKELRGSQEKSDDIESKPLVELNLLVNLYHKELNQSYNKLQVAVSEYVSYLISYNLDSKVEIDREKLKVLHLNICREIENMKRDVAELVKA
ncbi:TPA: hypothetical protein I7753_22165 [Vibrio vulnificus]|uniref:hypothetical protein n=1 Tax=Vibrio TaxID=662 RepID=UPI000C7A5F25|nr:MULTISPECIES: hypothetical protein [Vibrio]EGR0063637.1 hypothetical protein [Vibrio vulnificus]EHH2475332.1 hypothetical protein [Vibrio vulnificus]EKA7352446.1 hypothetical protein [Vibrio vulnificus]EKL0034332.1 hypothetical protein [Vibrio vulnificus]ELP8109813.1 hypothetical protein [Vibrio vulnificus]